MSSSFSGSPWSRSLCMTSTSSAQAQLFLDAGVVPHLMQLLDPSSAFMADSLESAAKAIGRLKNSSVQVQVLLDARVTPHLSWLLGPSFASTAGTIESTAKAIAQLSMSSAQAQVLLDVGVAPHLTWLLDPSTMREASRKKVAAWTEASQTRGMS